MSEKKEDFFTTKFIFYACVIVGVSLVLCKGSHDLGYYKGKLNTLDATQVQYLDFRVDDPIPKMIEEEPKKIKKW